MAYGLSENTIEEIQAFYHRDFISKDNLGWKIRLLTEKMLQTCGFVYVAEKGSVIHACSSYGTGINSLVPIDIAQKYGYTRLCKTCAQGTYVEQLLLENQKL